MDGSSTEPEELAIYRSYLLRLWREGQASEPWRASLQSAVTGERHGFASLDSLFEFIRREVTSASGAPPGRDVEEIGDKEVMSQQTSR